MRSPAGEESEVRADKLLRLRALADARKAARWAGYMGIGDYHGGVYECDYVSPYTKAASNVDADVMVLLQDWASDENLRGPLDTLARDLGYTPDLPTNRNLSRLLKTTFELDLADVYATNLFPFIKPGGLSSGIRQADMVRAAREFAIPQIDIVSPSLVICLGLDTFNALAKACGKPKIQPLDSAIARPFTRVHTQVWCQAHTGVLGQNNRNRGGVDRVARDWQRMKDAAGLKT